MTRRPALRSIAARTALLALLAALCCASPGFAEIEIETFPGFEGLVRPNSWTPLAIRLTGSSTLTSARLQLLVRSRDGTTVYAKPLRMRPGTLDEHHFFTYLHPGFGTQPEIVAQLVAGGRVVAEKSVEGLLSLGERQVAIAALTQDQSGLTYLNRLDLGFQHTGVARRRDPLSAGTGLPPPGVSYPGAAPSVRLENPLRVLYPRSSHLPDSSHGYGSIDVLALGDLPLDLLTEVQWEAIVEWVKDGGALVVSGGPDINRFRSRPLAEILPIAPSRVRQVRALPALGDRYGVTPSLGGQGGSAPTTALIDGSLKSDAVALCRQGDLPLVSMRRLGNGTVFFTAFDVMAPEFRAWRGQPALWTEILRLSARELRVGQLIQAANLSPSYASRQIADAMAGVQSTQAPSHAFIGLFLLLYLLCLVPLNYYLLKRRDRKEMAWITAPLIILLFTSGAYAVGRAIKGGQLFLRYGAVIEGAANTDAWAVYATAGIFSPSQTRYDLSIADPAALPTEVTYDVNRFQRATSDLTIERGPKTVIKDVWVNMWDHRLFGFESHLRLNGTIAASVLPAHGHAIEVRVTNSTPYVLDDCAVTYQGSSAPIGTLAPGQSQTVRLSLTGTRGSGGGVAIPLNWTGAQDNNLAQIKRALAWAAINNEGGVEGRNPLAFVGWFHEPVIGLALENASPHVEGVNLLVAHLPAPGAGSALSTPAPLFGTPPSASPDPFAGTRPGRASPRVAPPTGALPGGMPSPTPFSVPAIPQTGSGSRRIIQPAPGGGHYVIIQQWNNGLGGSSSRSSTTYVPPGQPIPKP